MSQADKARKHSYSLAKMQGRKGFSWRILRFRLHLDEGGEQDAEALRES